MSLTSIKIELELKLRERRKEYPSDGSELYEFLEEDWLAKFDTQGVIIHNEVQRSECGYLSQEKRPRRDLLFQCHKARFVPACVPRSSLNGVLYYPQFR